MSVRCIFSIDVEDWFHILDLPSTPEPREWDQLPSRVESNFRRLLDLLAENGVHATCFFLGWIARRFPHLVREAVAAGHEAASHGLSHRLAYQMSPLDFYRDAALSRRVIADAAGCEVAGYRASGFSVTGHTPWFFEDLAAAGYRYDSSVFPAPRAHGGMSGADCAPYKVETPSGEMFEFPITVVKILHHPFCFFGGGYLRMAPWWLIRRGAESVLHEERPVVFYIHPREIDPRQPRLPMSAIRRFKCYVNLGTTEEKVRHILSTFSCTTFAGFLRDAHAAPPPMEAVR
ncbi:MAG: polysaccharide deacetylase family protein [Acidobacteriota bacterium]|nr:polysaccharide deacetylase family protein [Acidobacteriota bacterium]